MYIVLPPLVQRELYRTVSTCHPDLPASVFFLRTLFHHPFADKFCGTYQYTKGVNFLRDGVHGLVPGRSNQDPGVLTYPRIYHVENGCTLARAYTGEVRGGMGQKSGREQFGVDS